MGYFITAEQAAELAFRAGIAAQQARSVGCMVELNVATLAIAPTAPQLTAEIELLECERTPAIRITQQR